MFAAIGAWVRVRVRVKVRVRVSAYPWGLGLGAHMFAVIGAYPGGVRVRVNNYGFSVSLQQLWSQISVFYNNSAFSVKFTRILFGFVLSLCAGMMVTAACVRPPLDEVGMCVCACVRMSYNHTSICILTVTLALILTVTVTFTLVFTLTLTLARVCAACVCARVVCVCV